MGHATLSNLLAIVVVPLLWAGSFENAGMFENLLPKIFLLVFVPCLIGCFLSKWFVVFAKVMKMQWSLQVPMLCIAWLVFLTICDGIDRIGKDSFLPELLTVLPYAMGFVTLIHLSGWLVFSKDGPRKRIFRLHNFFAYLKNRWPQDCLLRLFCFLKMQSWLCE